MIFYQLPLVPFKKGADVNNHKPGFSLKFTPFCILKN